MVALLVYNLAEVLNHLQTLVYCQIVTLHGLSSMYK